MLVLCGMCFAQYKPTNKDVGNDCTTQQGTLGTWKEVTVRDDGSRSHTTSSSSSYGGTVSGGYESKATGVSINASGSASSSRGNSNTSSSGTSVEYKDIRCVEDQNAKLPQQTPIRW